MADPIYVPGEGVDNPTYLIVAEAPGAEEEKHRRPMVGRTGTLGRYCMDRVGIPSEQIYITNVCHYRPPYNKIDKWCKKSKKHGRVPNELVVAGMVELYRDIARMKPKVIIPMGNVALWALTGHEAISKRRGTVYPVSVGMDRLKHVMPYFDTAELTSVFKQVMEHKCIATYHPSAVARQYNLKPIFEMDLKKAKRESNYPDVRYPRRNIYLDPDRETAYELASRILEAEQFGFDIETPSGVFYCISFACSPDWGFVLRTDQQWKLDLIQTLLESDVPKTAHNGLFDTTFLEYHNGVYVRNYTYDTMYAHKLFYPEYKQGLDFQTSFYTDEPYYKDEGKNIDLSQFEDEEQYMLYCGKDSCVMMEIKDKQEKLELRKPEHKKSWDSHSKLLPIARNMMVRGLRVDFAVMEQLRMESRSKLLLLQEQIDLVVLEHLYQAAQSHKNKDVQVAAYQMAVVMMGNMKANKPGFNVFSAPDMSFYLYKLRGFKEKRNKITKALTADEKALKELYGETGDETLLKFCKARAERTLQTRYLTHYIAPEGRMVFSVNIVGTKTQRWSASQTIVILAPRKKKGKKEKTGVNVQTLPYKIRTMVVPDPGMVLFYADLSQVEDRIVAYAGNVRAKIHAFENNIDAHAVTATGIFGVTVEQVLAQAKEYKALAKIPPWRYMGKQSNHAYNYGEGARTFKLNVNKKADETGIRITEAQAKAIRIAHFKLYPEIEHVYWEWIKEQLRKGGAKLTNPFGYSRTFYGRIPDETTFRDGYSWYPQSTAPEIINRSMVRIHEQLPEVETLVHAHDAIFGQVPEKDADTLRGPILELMREPLFIRDRKIEIPVDIKFGDNWGSLG